MSFAGAGHDPSKPMSLELDKARLIAEGFALPLAIFCPHELLFYGMLATSKHWMCKQTCPTRDFLSFFSWGSRNAWSIVEMTRLKDTGYLTAVRQRRFLLSCSGAKTLSIGKMQRRLWKRNLRLVMNDIVSRLASPKKILGWKFFWALRMA